MTIIDERLPVLDTVRLGVGIHKAPSPGTACPDGCLLEIVAWLAGEPWSDHPKCASPVVAAFLRSWNDTLPDDRRQDLKRYIGRLVGSAGTPVQEDTRAWMALDWLVRTYTPVWLRLAGLDRQADTLAGLAELRAGMYVTSIRPTIDAVRKDAAAAWAAVGAAAWAAVGDAARAAARAAAGDAAGERLAPTVTELQAAAHALVDRMLAVTENTHDTTQETP